MATKNPTQSEAEFNLGAKTAAETMSQAVECFQEVMAESENSNDPTPELSEALLAISRASQMMAEKVALQDMAKRSRKLGIITTAKAFEEAGQEIYEALPVAFRW